MAESFCHILYAFSNDIGNTDIVFGVNDDQQWIHQFRISSSFSQRSQDYEAQLRLLFLENSLKLSDIHQIIVSCVVPDLRAVIKDMSVTMFGIQPMMVGPEMYDKLNMEILSPYETGTDLVCNATYAYYTYQQTCLIVDFGTALTFTVVSGEGKILGVSIAPGLKTAVKSLFSNTAQLPEVPLIYARISDWKKYCSCYSSRNFVGLCRNGQGNDLSNQARSGTRM